MRTQQQTSVTVLRAVLSASLLMILAGCGGGGDDDDPPSNMPPADTTAPTVSVTALPAAVNRTVEIEATASDAVGVTEVQFFVDGTSIATDTTSPYSASWDTSAVAEGAHEVTARARDAAGNVATSAAVTTAVRNQLELAVTATGDQEVPVTGSQGTATGTIDVDVVSGGVSGSITISGFTANAAHIHSGFAGQNGGILIGLAQNGSDAALWEIPSGSVLTAEQIDSLLAGGLYINAHSTAFPSGEVRSQLLPENIELYLTDVTGAEVVPPVSNGGSARAATTVDAVGRRVIVNVNTTGLDTANAAHVHVGVPGQAGDSIITLQQDSAKPSLWSAADVEVSVEQLDQLRANEWYIDVHTPANPDGEARGQIIAVPPDTHAPTVTLGTIAANVNGTVTLTATASDDVDVTLVRFRVGGTEIGTDSTEPYSFDWDTTGTTNGAVQVTAEAEDAAHNVGTSAAVSTTVDNPAGPTAFKFSEIQAQIFDVRCIGCHSGPGAPQGLNLSAGSSYALLVNIASSEVPAMRRVNPGSADTSYIIHKLEGAADIVGERMPLGGPYLDQPAIDRIRAWIDAGAPND